VQDARRALVLGDGDGRFLARLLAANPGVAADYVDASGRMLQLARERTGSARVEYRQGDALTLPLAPAEYDLIATHFFLDCFDEAGARALISRVTAEFRQPWWAAPILGGLYLFFRVTTGLRTSRLVDHRPLLQEQGYRLERVEESWFGLLASELWVRKLLAGQR
jgi:SAM-dependent methyltransferase